MRSGASPRESEVEEHIDPASNTSYFVNTRTGETAWERADVEHVDPGAVPGVHDSADPMATPAREDHVGDLIDRHTAEQTVVVRPAAAEGEGATPSLGLRLGIVHLSDDKEHGHRSYDGRKLLIVIALPRDPTTGSMGACERAGARVGDQLLAVQGVSLDAPNGPLARKQGAGALVQSFIMTPTSADQLMLKSVCVQLVGASLRREDSGARPAVPSCGRAV